MEVAELYANENICDSHSLIECDTSCWGRFVQHWNVQIYNTELYFVSVQPHCRTYADNIFFSRFPPFLFVLAYRTERITQTQAERTHTKSERGILIFLCSVLIRLFPKIH